MGPLARGSRLGTTPYPEGGKPESAEAASRRPGTAPAALPPLCVDLDGTLLRTDTLWETVLVLMKHRPWQCLLIPLWLLAGRARLKEQLAKRVRLDYASLPYTPELLEHLRQAHAAGREIILVSACDRCIGGQVAEHLGLFAEVIASDGTTNLKGHTKARVLYERFGARGFDYAGNDRADLPVWAVARERLVVNALPRIIRRVEQLVASSQAGFRNEPVKSSSALDPASSPCLPDGAAAAQPIREFARRSSAFSAVLRALRCHQWSKNLLVFLPLMAGHGYSDGTAVVGALLIFAAWCLVASGTYVSNDLLDLEADRRHPTKRLRPFANGDLPLPLGMVLAPVLLLGGLLLAGVVSRPAAAALALYAVFACAYSFHLKKRSLVDVFALAFLFTIRVIGGGLACGFPPSVWLLTFTGFLFLGLAFLKRCSELERIRALGRRHLGSRGYGVIDLPVLQMFGVAAAFTSVMVLGLYLSSTAAETHYRSPEVLWAVGPFLLLWLCRLWLATTRGQMEDDPIVYSIKDRISWLLGACVLATFLLATYGSLSAAPR